MIVPYVVLRIDIFWAGGIASCLGGPRARQNGGLQGPKKNATAKQTRRREGEEDEWWPLRFPDEEEEEEEEEEGDEEGEEEDEHKKE